MRAPVEVFRHKPVAVETDLAQCRAMVREHSRYVVEGFSGLVTRRWAIPRDDEQLELFPIQQTFAISLFFPLRETSPASGGGGNSSSRKRHAGSSLQNPQNTFQESSIRGPGSSPWVTAALELGRRGGDQSPLFIAQQLLYILHNRSSPFNLPHHVSTCFEAEPVYETCSN